MEKAKHQDLRNIFRQSVFLAAISLTLIFAGAIGSEQISFWIMEKFFIGTMAAAHAWLVPFLPVYPIAALWLWMYRRTLVSLQAKRLLSGSILLLMGIFAAMIWFITSDMLTPANATSIAWEWFYINWPGWAFSAGRLLHLVVFTLGLATMRQTWPLQKAKRTTNSDVVVDDSRIRDMLPDDENSEALLVQQSEKHKQ